VQLRAIAVDKGKRNSSASFIRKTNFFVVNAIKETTPDSIPIARKDAKIKVENKKSGNIVIPFLCVTHNAAKKMKSTSKKRNQEEQEMSKIFKIFFVVISHFPA
jgi:hypothetical protein